MNDFNRTYIILSFPVPLHFPPILSPAQMLADSIENLTQATSQSYLRFRLIRLILRIIILFPSSQWIVFLRATKQLFCGKLFYFKLATKLVFP